MESQKLIGINIRRLRLERGVSQADLANLSGVDRTYVSRLERVVENPTVGILDRISAALEVSTAELFAPPSEDSVTLPSLRPGRPRKRKDS